MDEKDNPEFTWITQKLSEDKAKTICFLLIDSSDLPTLTEKERIVRSDGAGGFINDARSAVTFNKDTIEVGSRVWYIIDKMNCSKNTSMLRVVIKGLETHMNIEAAKERYLMSVMESVKKPANQILINTSSTPPITLFALQAYFHDLADDVRVRSVLCQSIKSCYYKSFYEIVTGEVFSYLLTEDPTRMAVFLFALEHYKVNPAQHGLIKPCIPVSVVTNMKTNMISIIATRANMIKDYQRELDDIKQKLADCTRVEDIRCAYKRFNLHVDDCCDLVFLYDLVSSMVSGARIGGGDSLMCVFDIIKSTKCVLELGKKILSRGAKVQNFVNKRMLRPLCSSTGNINAATSIWGE